MPSWAGGGSPASPGQPAIDPQPRLFLHTRQGVAERCPSLPMRPSQARPFYPALFD
ncbi:hypothetical protein IscW_ISCW006444 [Ixodes scapularis]|uniref:Uncharacterized protein n=1 Tax=Ixodes scapularis TaxID=6945 RepID=B7PKB4_IXOSC|nr:hypothetical protein IscW_ISCW006444 [Ixodes scapularis]|eukprot:XP_002399442.1 hypothetical protein IscW_ISCW006444 [Ixodes scapularis]